MGIFLKGIRRPNDETIEIEYDPESQNGGSTPSVKWVDLGVINAVDLAANGKTTLYTPTTGELVSSVRFGDDLQETDVAAIFVFECGSYVGVPNGNGAWYAYADIPTFSTVGAFDSTGQGIEEQYQAFNDGALLIFDGAAVILQAAPLTVSLGAESINGATLGSPPSWQANHSFPGFGSTIVETGHLWTTGPGGTSGGSKPDFAGHIGGSVADNDITWGDVTAVPTQGHLHAYAEIITPT